MAAESACSEPEPEQVMVNQIRSASQFTTNVEIQDQTIHAVVDTAAQVTMVSDKVYNALSRKPPKLRDVRLLAAGREMSMSAFVAGPLTMKIGGRWYKADVYVAPDRTANAAGFRFTS